MTLRQEMIAMGKAARGAAEALRIAPAEQRSEAILAIGKEVRRRGDEILAANAADVAAANSLVDRLMLNRERLEAIATSLEAVAALADPIGTVVDHWHRPNGLEIARVRTPIGVIGMIYESRPNVTTDAAAICLRSANALILRSGSDALRSSLAIHGAIAAGLEDAGLPSACVQIVSRAAREAVGMMLAGLENSIDLIIPRGGPSLVERVAKEARVAVLGHLEGVCHTYVHASADSDMAARIVRNAKLRRVSICGATETLLIDQAAAPTLLPKIVEALEGCELRGDEVARTIAPMSPAAEADWSTEYLAPVLAVRTVDGIDEAIAHIGRYGTGHTEAIITEDPEAAEYFLSRVDSAIVIWNASTQFADGGEFGFGAEIGIATGKLHARGPVGPEQLTTFKYQVRGSGQVRAGSAAHGVFAPASRGLGAPKPTERKESASHRLQTSDPAIGAGEPQTAKQQRYGDKERFHSRFGRRRLAKFCPILTPMSTMNISLPETLKSFVDEQVEGRGYGTSSEYVRELIRKDQDRQRLRRLLLEGVESPPGPTADRNYFARLRKRARQSA